MTISSTTMITGPTVISKPRTAKNLPARTRLQPMGAVKEQQPDKWYDDKDGGIIAMSQLPAI
ncbi:MAG: hypothetical protein IPO22_16070 [Anaerolineales bacterium]|nr:hypothetical protein [Anaerolineales bacterium]